MIIALIIAGLITIILLIGRINFSIQFSRNVKKLFLESGDISANVFRYEQLAELPEPVQRYFKHVLKEGQPYVNYVRLTHDGEFKMGLDKKWTKIKGEQYFTAEKPGYIWKGTTTLATARDMYLNDKGRLIVTLLSLVNVIDGQGKVFDEGEFQRWVSESVWFPTNLLPSEKLQWSGVDENTAKLIINYNELSVSFLVSFTNKGEITQMETRRFMEKGKKETWICKMADYKNINGILIPTTAEALWRLDKGDFSYAKFNVKKIEYNIPEKF